ncbi:hypothetical protein LJR130_003772 [Variovorax sp. LjRoot130]|uniref:hypothetical protein n=1 Tax=Variovorax sp. LjRoot130 TaxID=3342261 RepID=UPI003ECFEF81
MHHQKAYEATTAIRNELPIAVRQAVRTLLEKKHLYQSQAVDIAGVVKRHTVPSGPHELVLADAIRDVDTWPWVVNDDNPLTVMASAVKASNDSQKSVLWVAPDIKTYCPQCDRVEPFNSVSATNFLNRADAYAGGIRGVQVFVLSYLCQSCKSIPQVFLIRKNGTKLTLCGRAPMEHVDTPKTIPDSVAKYYSGAMIAFQSGQTLAALFLLRTLCEQWALLHAQPGDFADAAIEAYMATLPLNFKGSFPSIKALYSDLSEALHAARADDQLFAASAEVIRDHFEARKLFKLALPVTVVEPSKI